MGIRYGIITLSDKGARGKREDISGQVIKEMISAPPLEGDIVQYEIIPDEEALIVQKLIYFCDTLRLDLVLTTGGTGLTPRDVTPEATRAIIQREIPGIVETMRYEGLKKTPHAMLSRAVAGVRGNTLIINLPGSPKGVRESLEAILPALPHAIAKIKGDESECAR